MLLLQELIAMSLKLGKYDALRPPGLKCMWREDLGGGVIVTTPPSLRM